ncbi:STT3 domain-containing protein [Haloplanus halophilus]|uniref:STT3 domain-containing protein n=1 Tax=Haloplanus halophilus TaxID=2949993 RepID=UPI00203ECED1|nr:STT3 domain-containing protein [Haloplanus sp. GDY1]
MTDDDLDELLADRPGLASTLDRLLDADDGWHPDEEGMPPAAVAALLDAGCVAECADGYRFTDPAAVRSAIERAAAGAPRVPVRAAVAVALLLVVLVRLPTAPGVFRDGWIVLASNDPYFYRALVDQSLAGGPIPSLPERAVRGEPLLVATLATATALLGGSTWASGFVLAWYPVAAAVATAWLVYGIALRLSGDARVGLAAAGLLAVTPAHAYRTALGVADHHAFDYLWLALTVLAVVEVLGRADRDRRAWYAAAVLGVAVAAQTLSWEAAPLLLFPLAVSLALVAPVEVRRPGPERLSPLVAGLVGGAALAHAVHLVLGWQFPAVVYALDLLAVGGVGLLAATVGVRRLGGSWTWLAAAEVVLAAVAVVVVRRSALLSGELGRGVAFFSSTGAAELTGVGSNYGAVGVLVILGFAPVLAAPTLVWAAHRGWSRLEPGWLVVVTYVVHFGVLAALQRRFGGELAPFAAVLGGVAFVAFAAWLDLLHPPVPMRSDATTPAATDGGDAADDLVVPDRTRLALLGGLAGVVVGSGSLYAALIDRRLVIADATYEATRWITGYVERRAIPYPENYVLAKWGRVRVYNYFVNGEAVSYAYARRTYEDFLFSSDADDWYEEFDGRVGFVVTRDLPHLGAVGASTVQSCLHDRFGAAATEGIEGAGHFRALYATDSGDGARKVFRVVPGATLRGTADGAETVRLVADVSIPGADFEYVRYAHATDGSFEVTVAHPGRYRIEDHGIVVDVTDRAVDRGETLTV